MIIDISEIQKKASLNYIKFIIFYLTMKKKIHNYKFFFITIIANITLIQFFYLISIRIRIEKKK